MIKRIFDVSIAVGLLIILSPLMLLIASLLMFNLGLPILFKQARPGLLGRPFLMYKFRTMHEKTDTNGKSLSDNLRITNFGSHLRSSSLDELPSLWCSEK